MSRTAPSRFAFSAHRRCPFLLVVLSLVMAACSLSDPAVRPANDANQAPTGEVSGDTTSTTSTPATELPSSTVPADSPQATDEPADLDGLPGNIVRRTDNGDLVVSAPDGGSERQLAAGASALHSQPTWSNNGDRVAWSSVDADGSWLTIAAVADEATTIVANEAVLSPAFYLAWSPTDEWIAGLRNGASGIELTIAETDTASVRVAGPGQPFFTDWIADDQLLAAIGGVVLADIPTSGADATQRPLPAPLGAFQAPLALPQGDAIVALNEETNVITRLGAAGATPLATADEPVIMAANPQGTMLAIFVASNGAQSEVISFQPDPLPDLPAGQVSILDLETGDVATRPETRIGALNWSPDGETLAVLQVGDREATWLFIAGDSVTSGTPFVPSRELASAYLPFSDQYERSSTWWSPDSTAFVISGTVDGEAGVWVDRIDDDRPASRIGSGDIAFWSPQ